MSQDVNQIILCDHSDCPYWAETLSSIHKDIQIRKTDSPQGECGKDILYWDDEECIALKHER